MNLIDVPFKGPRFTWTSKRKDDERLLERLDKAYVSYDWFSLFPDVGITHYPIQFSDHAPIEINFSLNRMRGKRPYKIEYWSLEDKDCLDMISHNWAHQVKGSVTFKCLPKLVHIKELMKKWSLNKKRAWTKEWDEFDSRLGDALNKGIDDGGFHDYEKVHSDLLNFADAAAKYWRQRAKIKWDAEGDACTRYYFNWVKGRAGSNSIRSIKDPNGVWRYEEKEIGNVFQEYFQKLFSARDSGDSSDDFLERHHGLFRPVESRLDEGDLMRLNRPFVAQEEWSTVFQLGPLKSPGPDGIPAIFYQKCWHFIKK
ncbi:hypothetical protein RND81_04G094000 [Saponaria officinalis]|uniref:Reverse transcriptase n=1 Tax=Saponaria officinalis TaxID=3572 RepID=A0AAW1LDD9_SAPOF